MNNNPLVSIMIATFNQASLIERAIQTSLDQSYNNIEIIISDDCSMDKTQASVKRYLNNKNVSYHRHKQNLGRVANYHYALNQLAKGEWVTMLDGDDYYIDKDYISCAIQKIMTTENVLFYKANKTKTNERNLNFKHVLKNSILALDAKDYFRTYYKFGFSHGATIYNRLKAIEGDFYTKNIISSDIYSLLKLCLLEEGTILLDSKTTLAWYDYDKNESKNLDFTTQSLNMSLYSRLGEINDMAKCFSQKRMGKWIKLQEHNYLRSLIMKSVRINRELCNSIIFALKTRPSLFLNFRFYITLVKAFVVRIKSSKTIG